MCCDAAAWIVHTPIQNHNVRFNMMYGELLWRSEFWIDFNRIVKFCISNIYLLMELILRTLPTGLKRAKSLLKEKKAWKQHKFVAIAIIYFHSKTYVAALLLALSVCIHTEIA